MNLCPSCILDTLVGVAIPSGSFLCSLNVCELLVTPIAVSSHMTLNVE